jgi:hypothetical protein
MRRSSSRGGAARARRSAHVACGPAGRLGLGATVAIVAVLVAPNFDLTSEHSLGSAWRPKLEAARCDAGDRARIPVPPEPFGFVLEATCRDLR